MGYTEIYVVYGIQLDVKMMIRLFGKDIAEDMMYQYKADGDETWLKAEAQEDSDDEVPEPSNLIKQLRELSLVKNEDYIYDIYMDWMMDKDRDDIFKYHCCSGAADNTWILGIKIPKMGIQSLFDKSMGMRKLGNLDFPGGDQVKVEWQKLAVKYDLQKKSKGEVNGESSAEKVPVMEPDVYVIFNDCLYCT